MKEFLLLKFLDKFSGFFNKRGIDYKVMRRIIEIKLTLDKRRPSNLFQQTKKDTGKESFDYSLIIFGFIGLMSSIIIFENVPIFIKMNIITAMILFMVMTSLVADFSDVLLDVKDKSILSPRPISSKTLNTAKIIHIAYYLIKTTFAISIFSMVFGTIKYGPVYLIAFLVDNIFMLGFILFITSIVYFIILTLFDGERLKDVINYLQIAFAIIILVLYQLMGRIMNVVSMGKNFHLSVWTYLLPSAWFSAIFHIIVDGQYETGYIVLAVIGIILPIAVFIIYTKFIASYFEKNLTKLINFDNGSKKSGKRSKLKNKILSIICPNRTQRNFFRFAINMISSERKLKLTAYPYLAFGAILPFVFVFNFTMGNSGDFLTKISNGKYYFGIYYTLICASISIVYMGRSEKFKGAWIYGVLPLEDMEDVYKGTFKAFFIRLIFPITFVTSLIFMALCGMKILPDIIAIMINLLLLTIIVFKITSRELPFSKDFTTKYSMSESFISMGITVVIGLIHYLATKLSFGIWIYIVVALIAIIVMWKNAFKVNMA